MIAAARVRRAVEQLRAGGLVILYDDQRDQGDLAGGDDLRALALELRAPLVTISQLVDARFDELWSSHSRPPAVTSAPTDRRLSVTAAFASP